MVRVSILVVLIIAKDIAFSIRNSLFLTCVATLRIERTNLSVMRKGTALAGRLW